MAITIIDEITGTGTGNASSQVAVSTTGLDGGLAGHYIVVIMGAGDDSPSLAPPAGWTTGDRTGSSTGNDRQLGIFYLKLAAAPDASYTFTAGNSDACAWWIGLLAGVDQDTPEDEAMSGNATNLASNDATPAAVSINAATAGAFVLAGWANNYDATATSPTAGWDVRIADNPNSTVNLSVYSKTMAAPGATGDAEVTLDGAAECTAGQWAFRPAAAVVSNKVLAIIEL